MNKNKVVKQEQVVEVQETKAQKAFRLDVVAGSQNGREGMMKFIRLLFVNASGSW